MIEVNNEDIRINNKDKINNKDLRITVQRCFNNLLASVFQNDHGKRVLPLLKHSQEWSYCWKLLRHHTVHILYYKYDLVYYTISHTEATLHKFKGS